MVPVETIAPQPPPQVRILRFTGKISWEGQSNGLPGEIYAFEAYDASLPSQAVTQIIEKSLSLMKHLGGMAVQRNQGALIDPQATILDRIFVPWHWIVYVHPEIIVLGASMPIPDEAGVERLPNGTQALKN